MLLFSTQGYFFMPDLEKIIFNRSNNIVQNKDSIYNCNNLKGHRYTRHNDLGNNCKGHIYLPDELLVHPEEQDREGKKADYLLWRCRSRPS